MIGNFSKVINFNYTTIIVVLCIQNRPSWCSDKFHYRWLVRTISVEPVFDAYHYFDSLWVKLNLSWTQYSSMHENILRNGRWFPLWPCCWTWESDFEWHSHLNVLYLKYSSDGDKWLLCSGQNRSRFISAFTYKSFLN